MRPLPVSESANGPLREPSTCGGSSHGDFARLVAVAARVPQLPGKPFDLLAVSGKTSGPARAYLRAGVCERASFARTLSLSATSILSHEHRAVVIHVDLAPTATAKPETREPTAL